ncbi:MAG: sodium-independent anion transporter, partial [Chlamydiia bacterium]|nr:sodium-independent anion transporter [Chlamydiia bacterium]
MQLNTLIPTSIQCLREGYSLACFRKDFLAGLTVGIIFFPIALAVALGVNVPPERAIFTAIIAGFLGAALGGSRVQISGPTSTLIVILYDITLRYGFEGMLMATLMAGLILILFGAIGLGNYIKYMPYPVVRGLTTGLAVVIFSSQFKEFLGLNMGSVPIDFIGKWKAYLQHLTSWDPRSFGIGMSTLLMLIYFRRSKPHFPGPLIALILCSFFVWLFQIDIPTIGSRFG